METQTVGGRESPFVAPESKAVRRLELCFTFEMTSSLG
jgi:hypothetical protein